MERCFYWDDFYSTTEKQSFSQNMLFFPFDFWRFKLFIVIVYFPSFCTKTDIIFTYF